MYSLPQYIHTTVQSSRPLRDRLVYLLLHYADHYYENETVFFVRTTQTRRDSKYISQDYRGHFYKIKHTTIIFAFVKRIRDMTVIKSGPEKTRYDRDLKRSACEIPIAFPFTLHVCAKCFTTVRRRSARRARACVQRKPTVRPHILLSLSPLRTAL